MNRNRWKILWSALRSAQYWDVVRFYGKQDAEHAYNCFMAARPHPWNVFPFAPIEHRLAAFKAGDRPGYNYGFPKRSLPLP